MMVRLSDASSTGTSVGSWLAAPVVLGPWPGQDLPGQAAPIGLSLEEEVATLSADGTEVVVGVMEGPYVK